MIRRAVLGLACVLTLTVTGCGGDDEAAPLSLEQRLLQPGDLPSGFEQEGEPRTSSDVDSFVLYERVEGAPLPA